MCSSSRSLWNPVIFIFLAGLFGACSSSLDDPKLALVGCSQDDLKDISAPLSAPESGFQPAPIEAEASALAQKALHLSRRHAKAGSAEKDRLVSRIRSLLKKRGELLAHHARKAPKRALKAELPASLQALIPEDARQCLEKRISLQGTARVLVEESEPSRTVVSLRTSPDQTYSLHFPDSQPFLRAGQRLRASGVLFPCQATTEEELPLVVDSPVQALDTEVAPIAPRTFGAQSTAAILVSFSDEASPYSASTAQDVVFNQASSFLKENSFQQTWLTGAVLGPYVIPDSHTSCDPDSIANNSKAAALSAGADLSPYKRFIYIFPSANCNWRGLGTIGGYPSESWINNSLNLFTVAHELGHNFGLYHSNSQNCGASATIGSGCSRIEYGDTADVMGNHVAGHYNAFQKERLGWLDFGSSPSITIVTSPGTFHLDPYETQAPNIKALKVLKSANPSTEEQIFYYIEYRQPSGYDQVFSALITPHNLTDGVLVHTGSSTNANTSLLLNMNPGTYSWYQAALNPGQFFADSQASVSFTLSAADSGGATVQVDQSGGTPICVRSAPTIRISPAIGSWVLAGTPSNYLANIENNDSDTCTATTFNLATQAPAGVSVTLGDSSVALEPGKVTTVAVHAESGADLAPGAYAFSVSTSSSASERHSRSAEANYLVAASSGPSIAVFPDQPGYLRGENLTVFVTLAMNGVPAANTPFTLRITKPGGTTIAKNATTDADGESTLAFEITSCATHGNYRIQVNAQIGGGSVQADAQVSVN